MNTPLTAAARAAARYGIVALLGASMLAAQTSKSDDKKTDEPQKLEKFEVTGSRIQRLDTEGPQPVVTFTSEDISNRGFTTLGDFVQSLPFNSGSEDSTIQTASFVRGASTINPRGLGTGRFLVLLNGRRAVTYPLTTSSNRSIFDFNGIPPEAIDRIEYEKDGASAIYGSDAVTGVMNIKLKKSYSGMATSLYLGNTLNHDTFTRSFNVLAGADAKKTSIMVNVGWWKQNANYIDDYNRSKTTDYSSLGTNKGANLNSTANWPANLTLTAAQASAAGFTQGAGSYVITNGTLAPNPTKGSFSYYSSATLIPNANRYDFAKTYELIPPTERRNAFIYLNHDINDKVSVFGQITYSNNYTWYNFTPTVATSTTVGLGTPVTYGGTTYSTLVIPATNPYNPLGININNFGYRTNFGPVRKFDTEFTGTNLLGGLKGDITPEWHWETGWNYGYNLVTAVSRNQIKADDLQAALGGTTRQTALNPFGPSDNQSLVDKLFTISNSSARAQVVSGDATISGKLFQMPALLGDVSAGDVGLAVGGEWRQERLEGRPDTTAYVGTGGGTPFTGSRTVVSQFVEVGVPVVRRYLELQVAARHEHYSDFGNTTKPKFSFTSQPLSFLKLRGSYSQSFKAPDLGQLYTTRLTAFTSTVITDPLRPSDPPTQLKLVTGGNPLLQPENGKVWYGGAVFDAGKIAKALDGLSFNVDYFNFDIKNIIVSYTNTTTIFNYFPQRVIRDNTTANPGPIQYLEASPINAAEYFYRGFDLGMDYQLRRTRFGDFGFGVQATRIMYYGQNSGLAATPTNYVGTYNIPRWTGNAQVNWRYREYGASLSGRYIGPYFNDGYTTTGWGENPIGMVNATVSYNGFWGTKLTVGCQNLLNTEPHRNGRETSGFDQSTYGAWSMGRFLYVQVKKEF